MYRLNKTVTGIHVEIFIFLPMKTGVVDASFGRCSQLYLQTYGPPYLSSSVLMQLALVDISSR